MKLVGVLILAAILLAPSVLADYGSVKLLALIQGDDEDDTGTLADLELETRSGHERVFLETFPLTKIATQISMRFAQQIACSELDADCSGKDFFFTIRASPGIVGGPSAGAAAAVLTASLVDNRDLDPAVGITGTINSGGLIGPVGGLKQKIEAAADGGLEKVLIPRGTSLAKEDNSTIDLVAYGNELGIEIVEVATLDEALAHFTGEGIYRTENSFVIDKTYAETMKAVAVDLCTRSQEFNQNEEMINLSTTADTFFAQGEYYSAASYCFRLNIIGRRMEISEKDWTVDEFQTEVAETLTESLLLDSKTERQEIRTVTDLQTYMLVKERIIETQDALGKLNVDRVTNGSKRELAYAQERLHSAKTWTNFFGTISGENTNLNNETLQRSCQSKLGEAEERYNYVQTFFPNSLQETRKTLDKAEHNLLNGEYVLCLHQAAKSKSEADVLLSVTGVDDDRVQEIIDTKLQSTERALARAQSKDIFPLIGYSYYEYSQALRKEDPYSALLFAEYANEMKIITGATRDGKRGEESGFPPRKEKNKRETYHHHNRKDPSSSRSSRHPETTTGFIPFHFISSKGGIFFSSFSFSLASELFCSSPRAHPKANTAD